MGYVGAYADTISDNDIKKVCRSQWKKFEMSLGPDRWEDFIYARYHEEDLNPDTLKAFENLKDTFYKKTGLTLDADYHDSENNGDRYDDIQGAYWCVEGVWTVTTKYKKAKKLFKITVNRKMFVQYG
jgi:hypothetical protein